MSFIWSAPVSEAQIHQQVTAELNDAALNQIRDSINSETADRTLADFFIKADITTLSDTVTAEINARVASDTYLLEKIELEEIARANAALSLADDIRAETAARVDAETELRDVFNTAIDNEKALRTQADAALTNNFANALGSETAARQAALAAIYARIGSETALLSSDTGSLSAAVQSEAQTRATEDGKLSAAIEAERQARIAADASYFNSATTLISSETNLRAAADNALDAAITAEIQTRISEDSRLTAAISSEKTARENADSNLSTNFNAAIAAEKTARENADAELQSSLAQTLATYAPLNSPTFTGVVKIPALTTGSDNLAAANKSYVDSAIASVAENLSAFTAPTQSTDGKQGLVPAPKKTSNLEILTNLGWRTLDDTSITIGTLPAQSGALTYNGVVQSPTWLNYDEAKLKITGTTTASDAGTYTATVTPLDLYIWADSKTQEPRPITWKIDALKLAKPTASVTEFTYNRSQQGITVSNFDSTYMTQSGSTTATAAASYSAASYSAVYALKSKTNTTWSDGSTDNVTIPWKINVLKIAKPAAATTEFVYDGDSKTLSVTNFNNIYMSESGTKTGVSVGNYSIVYKLLDAANVHWADNSTADFTLTWKIIKAELSAEQSTGFAQSGEQTYTGSEITVAVTNFNPEYHVLGGDFKKTNVGTYTATVSPAGSYVWADGSTTPKTFSWTIGKAKVDKPAVSTTSFNYTGATITFVPTHAPDSNSVFVISSDSTKSAALIDNYAVKYNLRDTANYTWADGSSGVVTLSWSIVANKLSADLSSGFAQVTPLTFNGANQTVTISHTSATYHTVTGNVQSNAGTYTATIAPVYGYAWNDGSTAAKTVSWKIAPVEVSIPWLDGSDYEYTGSAINAANDLQDFNSNYVQLSGDLAKTEPDVYTITATLKNANYVWGTSAAFPEVAVGDTAAKTVSWRILGKPITPPAFVSEDVEFTYSGAQKSVTVTGFQSTYMESTGTLTATDAGTYTISYTLKDTVATRWADGTQGAVVLTWKIKRQNLSAALSTFSVSGEYYYNESEQTVAISGYNATYHTLSGTTTARLPATYTATVAPKDNYAWSDGTTAAKNIAWTLKRAVVRINSAVTVGDNTLIWAPSYTYTGSEIQPEISYTVLKGAVTDFYANNSNYRATNAGDYSFVIMGAAWYSQTVEHGSGSLGWLITNTYFTYVDFVINGNSSTFETVTVNWKIERKRLTAAQSNLYVSGTYTYNGAWQVFTIVNFNSAYHGVSNGWSALNGCFSDSNMGLNAGDYTVTVGVNSNYAWSDGSTDNKTFAVTMNRKKFNKPYATQDTFTYSGDVINFGSVYVSGIDGDWMSTSGRASATVPGNYTFNVALKDTNNCAWNDDSVDRVALNWEINPYVIPSANSSGFYQLGELTCNGASQTVTIARMDAAHSYLSGITSSNSAGTYTAYVNPNQYHTWSDGSTDARAVSWTIKPKVVAKPYCTRNPAEIEWTGSEINWLTTAIADFDSTGSTAGSGYAKTAIGSYSFTVKLISTRNYVWSDGTTDDVTFSWAIIRQRSAGGSRDNFYVTGGNAAKSDEFYYNDGSAVTFTIANYDSTKHSIYRNETATSATTTFTETDCGVHTWYAEPKANYAWSDGSTGRQSFIMEIKPMVVTISYTQGVDSDGVCRLSDADTAVSSPAAAVRKTVKFKFLDVNGNTVKSNLNVSFSNYASGVVEYSAVSLSNGFYTVTLYGKEVGDSGADLTFTNTNFAVDNYGGNGLAFISTNSRTLASVYDWAAMKAISDSGRLIYYGDIGDSHAVKYGSTNYIAVLVDTTTGGRGVWAICKKSGVDGHFALTNSGYYHAAASATSLTWSSSNLRSKLTAIYNGLNCKAQISAYTVNANSTDITDYVWTMSAGEFNGWGYFGYGNKAAFHDSAGNVVKVWTRECWYDANYTPALGGTAVSFNGSSMTTEELDASTPLGLVPCFVV